MKNKIPPEDKDPTPALPLPGEGARFSLRQENKSNSKIEKSTDNLISCTQNEGGNGTINSSPWEGGGWEGVFVGDGSYINEHSIFNPLKLKTTRKELRNNITEPENILWQRIRNKSLGTKFRRQHGIGRYIVDFYCQEYALIIELDGDSHFTDEAQEYDQQRDLFMENLGIETLRFTNQDVMKNIEGVLLIILEKINLKRPHPSPPLPREGARSKT
jgi:very-short-patch-repair endonuclease